MMLDASEWLESEASPAFISTVDGDLIAANQSFARLLHLNKADLAGAALRSFVTEPGERVGEYLRMCSRSREPFPGSVSLSSSTGAIHEMRAEARLLRPPTRDEPALVVAVLHAKEDAGQQ